MALYLKVMDHSYFSNKKKLNPSVNINILIISYESIRYSKSSKRWILRLYVLYIDYNTYIVYIYIIYKIYVLYKNIILYIICLR